MNIKLKDNSLIVSFGNLENGKLFYIEPDFYVKIEPIYDQDDDMHNAINLTTGFSDEVSDNISVKTFPCHILTLIPIENKS